MVITVEQITDNSLVGNVAGSSNGGRDVKLPLKVWVRSEHSPIRALNFKIRMEGIPTFVSTHLARHKHGIEHYVESNRPDLQKKYKKASVAADRNTPVVHTMLCNAQALINLARRRLCIATHYRTRRVIEIMISEVVKVNPDLGKFLVVECVYRNGLCNEPKCCGFNKSPKFKKILNDYVDTYFNGNVGYARSSYDNPTRGGDNQLVDDVS